MIDAFCSQLSHLAHTAPILQRAGGVLFAGSNDVLRRASLLGLTVSSSPLPVKGPPVLMAGAGDIEKAGRRGVILAEHGVGQTYAGIDHPSYVGGHSRDGVRLFLCPRQEVADTNLARYPSARAVVIGSPHVQWLQTIPRTPRRVVLSRHWDAHSICPEALSAWAWYQPAIDQLAVENVWGVHAHPRVAGLGRSLPESMWIPRFEDVIAQASVYVCDNSSTIFEAAACGIPVVLLNAPWYRRDVEHGLRFWSEADVGVQCDDAGQLEDAIAVALADRPALQRARAAALGRVFAEVADPAGMAVDAIRALHGV